MDKHSHHKALLAPLREAMYNFDEAGVRRALSELCTPDCVFRYAHPLGEITGVDAFYEKALAPLFDAWQDLERRDWIVMAGGDDHACDWVGCGGNYYGCLRRGWIFHQQAIWHCVFTSFIVLRTKRSLRYRRCGTFLSAMRYKPMLGPWRQV